MSFSLTPKEYLDLAKQAFEEFKAEPLSKRRLISVCVFVNHLPEIVFAEYINSNPAKVQNHRDDDVYRTTATAQCAEIGIVRDLCDFGKHGPVLGRKTVVVKNTGAKEIIVLDAGMFLLGFPTHRKVEKLVVEMKDKSERTAESVVATALEFWEQKFVTDGL